MTTENKVSVVFEAVIDDFRKKVSQIKGDIFGLSEEITVTLNEIVDENETVVESFKEVSDEVINLRDIIKEIADENKQLVKSLNLWKAIIDEIKKANKQNEKSKDTIKKSTEENKKFGESFKDVIGEANRLEKSISKFINAFVVKKGIQFGKYFVDEFSKVEDKMQEVATKMPNFNEQIREKLFKNAKAFSDESGTAMEDVMQSVYDALSDGIEIEDVFPFLKDTDKLAKAGVASLADTASVLAVLKNSYGGFGYEVNQMSDFLLKAVDKGLTSIPELAANFGDVVTVASNLKIPLEEVMAGVTTATAQTDKGDTPKAMTQMKAFLEEMSSDKSGMGKTFADSNGMSFSKYIQSGGSLKEVLKSISDYAKNTGSDITKMFNSSQAGSFALNVTANNMEMFNNVLGEMGNEAGVTENKYRAATDTISFRLDKISNKFKNTLLSSVFESSDGMKSALDSVLAKIDEMAADGTLDEFSQNIADLIGQIVNGFVEFIPHIFEFFGFLTDNLPAIIELSKDLFAVWIMFKVFSGIVGIIDSFVSPLGWVKLAIGGIVGLIMLIQKLLNGSWFDTLFGFLEGVLNRIMGINNEAKKTNDNLHSMSLPPKLKNPFGTGEYKEAMEYINKHGTPNEKSAAFKMFNDVNMLRPAPFVVDKAKKDLLNLANEIKERKEKNQEENPIIKPITISSSEGKKKDINDYISDIGDKYSPELNLLDSKKSLAEANQDSKTTKSIIDMMTDLLNKQADDLQGLSDKQTKSVDKMIVDTAKNRILLEIKNLVSSINDTAMQMIGEFNRPSDITLLNKYMNDISKNKDIQNYSSVNFPGVEIIIHTKDDPQAIRDGIVTATDSLESTIRALMEHNLRG